MSWCDSDITKGVIMDARSFKENGYQSAIVQDTRAQKMDKESVIIKFLLRINAIDFIIYEIIFIRA